MLVVVLQLRLSERGLVRDRPVDRLERAIDEPLLDEIGKHFQDRLLIVARHGEIGMLVIRQRQQPLHLCGLQLVIFLRVLGALAPNSHAARVLVELVELLYLAGREELGHHHVLDGKPVAIPAGHVGAVLAAHQPGAHNEVLEHLVEQMTSVQQPVGIGRAVVKHERLGVGPLSQRRVIQLHLLPPLLRMRLVLRQPRPHGKVGLGQVQRLLVVGLGCFSHRDSESAADTANRSLAPSSSLLLRFPQASGLKPSYGIGPAESEAEG